MPANCYQGLYDPFKGIDFIVPYNQVTGRFMESEGITIRLLCFERPRVVKLRVHVSLFAKLHIYGRLAIVPGKPFGIGNLYADGHRSWGRVTGHGWDFMPGGHDF
jgi:hypothetical protein